MPKKRTTDLKQRTQGGEEPPSIEKVKASKIDLTATARKPVTTTPSRAVAPKLAAHGDPYVTSEGKVVQPEHMFGGEEHVTKQVKATKSYRPIRKRALKELPAEIAIMKGVVLVFSLTILGVSDREIADSLGITISQVRSIREHSAYGETFEIISSEFVNANSQRLVAKIAAYADDALEEVHTIAQTGKESNRLRASIDILDRAGVRPKDTAAQNQAQQNELRITIMRHDGQEANVTIGDVTVD